MGRIADAVVQEVLSWPGVEARPHRFGGVELIINHREIGHLHGDRLADLPFPMRIRDELVAASRARPHHVRPDSGWISRWIRGSDDVADVIALFRLNYERLAAVGRSRPRAKDQSTQGPKARETRAAGFSAAARYLPRMSSARRRVGGFGVSVFGQGSSAGRRNSSKHDPRSGVDRGV